MSKIESVFDDACVCGETPPCKKVKCANCGTEDFKCEMRRSIRLVLTTDAPEDYCYFCSPCWQSEGPDEY